MNIYFSPKVERLSFVPHMAITLAMAGQGGAAAVVKAGGLAKAKGLIAEATDLIQKQKAADPRTPKPYNTLAAFLDEKGQPQEALKLYKRSLQIEWNQPPVGEAIGRLDKSLQKLNANVL